MLRYTIRRILWAIPTIFGISIVAFLVTTLIPAPPRLTLAELDDALAKNPAAYDAYVESRRASAFDLPAFVNESPRDVQAIVAECVDHLAKNDAGARVSAHELARIGGAGFPYLLPTFDRLEPAARERVALALLPVAERMGQADDPRAHDPASAPTFWTQLWEDRSLEFTGPAVRRSVQRLARGVTAGRERDLIEVDTFALPELMRAMRERTTTDDEVARLSQVASHVSGHAVVVPIAMTHEAASRIRADWASWWTTHREDYVALDAGERIFATLSDTRYGRWLLGAVTGELGTVTRDGEPASQKLAECAPVTLALTLSAMFLSFAIAVPIGVIGARRRGTRVDRALAGLIFLFYSLPSFFLAELLDHAVGPRAGGGTRAILAILVMTASSVATLSRFQRASMMDVLDQDWVRTARAKGLRERRVLVVHALRNAIVPMVTLAGVQLPFLFGTAIVVEEVFQLPGMGYETMRAVESHDATWLVATVLVVGLGATLTLLASDIAYGFLDPRIRERLLKTREVAE
ncbi:MAG TPA: ABC transporter permease [Polyangiaceae bacterium]|jgi:ABC-type dipeptide/oligopeptide/nickel transport system permease component